VTLTGEDLELFGRSLEHAVASDAVDDALLELGWSEALVDDPRAAVSLLFEHQGRAGATSGALSVVLVGALGLDEAVTVVLPTLGSTTPPGHRSSEHVDVAGLAIGAADRLAVPLTEGVVVVDAASLTARSVGGLDPRLGLAAVHGTVYDDVLPAGPWAGALAAGQRALAHEMVGAARAMLELARTHALERIQFDHPIARFQAVRHRLAESLVAIETAASALDAAWLDPTPLGAAVAKAVAGRSARTVAKHSQQVLAGIGFTLEHPLHTYVRRVLTLDRLLGDATSLTRAMGEELLRTRRLPPMLPL
jgi:hypothetical protein